MLSRYNYNSIIYRGMSDNNGVIDSNEEIDNLQDNQCEDINKINSKNDRDDLIENLIKKNEILEEKLDRVLSILNDRVVENTEKMSNHIDLIENIYNNVKSPLGYICNKINYLKGNDPKIYSIES